MNSVSNENLETLLVFGYESKIYRDDEKAQWIENGGHLIPWMGNAAHMIDRYDVRNTLSDIKLHEPKGNLTIDPLEAQIEEQCDLERYLECNEDEVLEEYLNQDEDESKDKKYAQFGYSYDEEEKMSTDVQSKPVKIKKRKRDEPYEPPPGLYLPPDLILPETCKMHAIVEKTAKFILSHGSSMEIILKAKQDGNPMFNFLTHSDSLNPYYKYILTALRSNAYQPIERKESSSSDETSSGDDEGEDVENGSESGDEHYLHPSLFSSKSTTSNSNSTNAVSSVISEYKSSGPNVYSSLVTKIQEMEPPPPPPPPPQNSNDPSFSHLNSNCNTNLNSILNEGLNSTNNPPQIAPVGEDQIVIEKMAMYVAKNGPAFECLASTKGDPRFKFLNPDDPYHWYYEFCKSQFIGGVSLRSSFIPYQNNAQMHQNDDKNTLNNTSPDNGENLTNNEESKVKRTSRFSKEPQLGQNYVIKSSKSLPNHEHAKSKMATLPPELINKIETLRQRSLESKAADLKHKTDNFQLKTADLQLQTADSLYKTADLQLKSADLPTSSNLIPNFLISPINSFTNEQISNLKVENSEEIKTEVVEETGENKLQKIREERKRKLELFLKKIKEKESDNFTKEQVKEEDGKNLEESAGVEEKLNEFDRIPVLPLREDEEEEGEIIEDDENNEEEVVKKIDENNGVEIVKIVRKPSYRINRSSSVEQQYSNSSSDSNDSSPRSKKYKKHKRKHKKSKDSRKKKKKHKR